MARVKKITLKNIMAFDELEIEPGVVTLISGPNGSGKTSVLEGIMAIIGGGHDATLLRNGAEKGEAVLVLDDGVEFTKTVTPTSSELSGRHPTMGRISAAQTYLKGLTNWLSVSPVAFLTAEKKDRVRLLLEAMPLTIEPALLAGALEGTGMTLPPIKDLHALQAIAKVRQQVFDERTEVNRRAREQRTTADQLKASLPSDFESAVVLENQLKEMEGAHRDADRELQRKLSAIDTEVEREVGVLRGGSIEVRVTLTQAEWKAVAEYLADKHSVVAYPPSAAFVVSQIRGPVAEADARIAQVRAKGTERKEAVMLERRPQVNQLAARVAQLKEQIKAADRYESTKTLLQQTTSKAEAAEARSESLTGALQHLDRLKAKLIAQLPIAGVEIRDGDIYRDDITFSRLNHAQQVQLAVEVAKLRAGGVPLICVDGLECLDSETFYLFVQELAKSDVQAVVTRVSDRPFKIATIAAEEPAHA